MAHGQSPKGQHPPPNEGGARNVSKDESKLKLARLFTTAEALPFLSPEHGKIRLKSKSEIEKFFKVKLPADFPYTALSIERVPSGEFSINLKDGTRLKQNKIAEPGGYTKINEVNFYFPPRNLPPLNSGIQIALAGSNENILCGSIGDSELIVRSINERALPVIRKGRAESALTLGDRISISDQIEVNGEAYQAGFKTFGAKALLSGRQLKRQFQSAYPGAGSTKLSLAERIPESCHGYFIGRKDFDFDNPDLMSHYSLLILPEEGKAINLTKYTIHYKENGHWIPVKSGGELPLDFGTQIELPHNLVITYSPTEIIPYIAEREKDFIIASRFLGKEMIYEANYDRIINNLFQGEKPTVDFETKNGFFDFYGQVTLAEARLVEQSFRRINHPLIKGTNIDFIICDQFLGRDSNNKEIMAKLLARDDWTEPKLILNRRLLTNPLALDKLITRACLQIKMHVNDYQQRFHGRKAEFDGLSFDADYTYMNRTFDELETGEGVSGAGNINIVDSNGAVRNFPIIGRDTGIAGHASVYRRENPAREIIIIDDRRPENVNLFNKFYEAAGIDGLDHYYQQLKGGINRRLANLRKLFIPDSEHDTLFWLKAVGRKVMANISYSSKDCTEEKYDAYLTECGIKNTEHSGLPLSLYVHKGIGVCSHMALYAGYLVEKLIKDGTLNGKVWYLRGVRDEADSSIGHAFIAFEDRKSAQMYYLEATSGVVIAGEQMIINYLENPRDFGFYLETSHKDYFTNAPLSI
jgi:hypothetical protein